MNEDGGAQLDGRMPELIEIDLPEIDPFDIRCDHEAGGSQLLHCKLGLARRRCRVRQRHGGEQREPVRVLLAKRAERFIEQPMPARRGRAGQPVAKMSGQTESTCEVTPCAAMPSSRSSTGSISF